MEGLDLSKAFKLETLEKDLGRAVHNIRQNPGDHLLSKGVFVSGKPGCGKTTFVLNAVRKMGYDAMVIGSGDVRNKETIESLADGNVAERSVISMFKGASRPVVIVLDDVDCLSAGGVDKGSSSVLVKLIRPQKNRRHIGNKRISHPVICIGSCAQDKKTRELAAACGTFLSVPTPSTAAMLAFLDATSTQDLSGAAPTLIKFAAGNMHQLCIARDMLEAGGGPVLGCIKSAAAAGDGGDSRELTANMIQTGCTVRDHDRVVPESDRAILGLSLHENIPRVHPSPCPRYYLQMTTLFSDADCLDRAGFQNQVAQLSELSSILKNVCTTHALRHTAKRGPVCPPRDTRFTRVLTKYSLEYSNMKFIQSMCSRMGLSKKDLHNVWKRSLAASDGGTAFDDLGLTQLELNRLGRYFDFPDLGDAAGSH